MFIELILLGLLPLHLFRKIKKYHKSKYRHY
jgi:hypothetical protein